MKTYLYIKVNDQWKEVDMFNDISIPITLKVTDIRQFGSKSSGYSLDFDIPHTANNAILFGLNADIDVYRGSFEVGKDYEAYLSDGCFTTFQGQFRLKKVVKQNSGKYIFYVGYLYGGTKTFVDKLGNQTLTGNEDPNNDLNFSEYNTPAEEMTLSDFVGRLQMEDTSGEDWGLTLLDKTSKYTQGFSGGSQQWYTNECTPYLGAMGIFNRIISGAGYQYTSKFLMGNDGNTYLTDDDRWKDTIGKFDVYSIIYPYMRHNSTLINNAVVNSTVSQISDDSKFNIIENYTTGDYIYAKFPYLSAVGTSLNFPSNLYSLTESGATSTLSNYTFTAPINGNYKIDISIPFDVGSKFAEYVWNSETSTYDIVRLLTSGEEVIMRGGTADTRYSYFIGVYKNNTPIRWSGIDLTNCSGTYTLNSNGEHIFYNGSISYNEVIPLNAGDTISIRTSFQIKIQYYYQGESISYYEHTMQYWRDGHTKPIFPYPFFLRMNHSSNDIIFSANIQEGFYEEADFFPNSILNPKTSKLEYFNEFVKMFNLYVEDVSGKKNYETGGIYPDKCLRIEPYECFYAPLIAKNDTNLKDWTDRIDWDVVEYMRIEDYLYNTQKFTKIQNKDYFNEQYDSTYILPYADRDIKGPYCTSDEKNSIELKSGAYLCGIVNSNTDVLQCPKVFTRDKSNNIDVKKEYSDGFFFRWRNYMNQNTELVTNYTLKLQSLLSSSYQNMTNYFCADTLNKGYGLDDANLNWGPTDNYYQNMKGTIPTYNDLYSAFYKKQYEEYTDPDARIMKAKAYLTAFDIATVQMSDGIIIDDHLWRILEIKEWRDEKTPCVIELIKVLEGVYKPPVETPPGVDINEPYVPIEDPEVIK